MRRILFAALVAALFVPVTAQAAPAVRRAPAHVQIIRHRHYDRLQAWTQHLSKQGLSHLKNVGEDLVKQLRAGKKLDLHKLRASIASLMRSNRKPAQHELDHAATMAMHFATDAIHREARKGGVGGKIMSFADKQLAAHHADLDKGIHSLMSKLGDQAQGGVLKALSWI